MTMPLMSQMPLMLFILVPWILKHVSVGLRNLKTMISIFSTVQNLEDLFVFLLQNHPHFAKIRQVVRNKYKKIFSKVNLNFSKNCVTTLKYLGLKTK